MVELCSHCKRRPAALQSYLESWNVYLLEIAGVVHNVLNLRIADAKPVAR